MEQEIINKIMQKKELSKLPKSIIERVLQLKEIKNLDDESKVKKSRALLRKGFSAFLTNKVLSGKEPLKSHYSTKYRDYDSIYEKILGNEESILDLGAGINGLSLDFIRKYSNAKYIAVEAAGQLVEIVNNYFKNKENAVVIHEDLFNLPEIIKILEKSKKPRKVLLFNVVDALEMIERDFSKKFILSVSENCEEMVLSFPTKSLVKRKEFQVKRYWLIGFLEENFKILNDFEENGERFICFRKL